MNRTSNQVILSLLEGDVADLDALLKRIRQGDGGAAAELLETCGGGVRFFLQRTFRPRDLDSAVSCVSQALIRRIRGDSDNRRLAELIRLAAADCGFRSAPLSPPAAHGDKVRMLRQTLRQCTPKEREFLVRCYLQGEDPASVSEELGMTREAVAALRRRLGRPGSAGKAASAGR